MANGGQVRRGHGLACRHGRFRLRARRNGSGGKYDQSGPHCAYAISPRRRRVLPMRAPADRHATAPVYPLPVVAHRVNGEAVVVLGWGRAILLQVAHPLVAAGVRGHSGFDAGPRAYVRRMRRTIGAMLSLTFGTESEIRRTADRINAVHRRVRGRLDRAAGRYPTGNAVRRRGPGAPSPGCTPPSSTASSGPTRCSSAR